MNFGKIKGSDHNLLQVEKENPNLITVFICFLRSGLRFTRYDTNNVGLAFIDEIKKHNPNFKPEKVQQRERDQIYTVNAYPKEFEQLIMSLIEEYRIKHKLEYRLKKPRGGGRGGFNRGGGGRPGGGYNQNRDNRGAGGGYPRPRRDEQGGSGYGQRRDDGSRDGGYRPRRDEQGGGYGQRSDGNRDGGYRPRRNYDGQSGQGGYRPAGRDNQGGYGQRREDGNRDGGYRPRREPGGSRDGNSQDRNSGNRENNGENRRPRRPRTDSND